MEGINSIEVRPSKDIEVDFNQLINLQPEEYKDLSDENYAKLRNSIVEMKFSDKFDVWEDKEGKLYTVDGHQRIRVLRRMQEEGIQIPLLPATSWECANKTEAKKLLLVKDSEYGKRQREGFDMFVDEPGFEIEEDFSDVIAMPDMEYFEDPMEKKPEKENKGSVEKICICPNCNSEHKYNSVKV